MRYQSLDALCTELQCAYTENEPMAAHTSFKIGGNADRFITVTTKKALAALLALLNKENIPWFILGNGSNLLVRDEGIRGVVMALSGVFKEMCLLGENTICCGAGATLASVCVFARSKGLTGLEFAYGIPGTAGGAAYMNAGAYGGEMKDVLAACAHVNEKGEEGSFSGEALKLAYRRSAYTDSPYVITELHLCLKPGSAAEIARQMEALMNRRVEKQPLELPSAGSTFKRPEGYFAAALIEECGLKGACVGGAQVSEKHSGFLVNKGGATCKDVLGLIEKVKDTVYSQKGVTLECEVKLIGSEEKV